MGLIKKDVEYVARLARLDLTEQEKEQFTTQLGKILNFIEKLSEIDTSKVEPMAHPFSFETAWREDKAIPWNKNEEILANAPDREESYFKVNKVIE